MGQLFIFSSTIWIEVYVPLSLDWRERGLTCSGSEAGIAFCVDSTGGSGIGGGRGSCFGGGAGSFSVERIK